MNENYNDKYLTVTRVAKHIGIPKRTLYMMIKDGRFDVEPRKDLQPRRWHIDNVNAWMKQR